MAFDFKKAHREFYLPKAKPEIVTVPAANYLAVRGEGNPNEVGGAYQRAVQILYTVGYTLKMSYRSSYQIDGFFEYVMPPLESFWWQEGIRGVDYQKKSSFCWICVLRLPDFIQEKDFRWAVQEATQKKKLDCSSAEFLSIDEGLSVQMLHIGPYDAEPATVAIMDTYIDERGYQNDLSGSRLHHEIYLSNPQKTEPSKLKTVIRHPIKRG